jgi:putative membrane protein
MIANRISRQLVLFSASALLASVPAFACAGPDCPCQTIQQAMAAISALEAQATYTYTSSSNLQTLFDQEFIREALEGGAAKVLLGQLAQQKSQSDDIRQFGQKMVQDHTQLSEQVVERVAKLIGVKESKGLSRKDKQLAATLDGLSGPQFDEEFIKAMVKDHKQDLKKFSSEAQLTQDPSVKIAADQGTNVISQHLLLLERIAENHDVVAQNHNVAIERR